MAGETNTSLGEIPTALDGTRSLDARRGSIPAGFGALCARVAGSLRKSWAAKSLAAGAIASGCDYVVLATCAYVFSLGPAVCAMAGFAVGAALNFLLNRSFAFRDCEGALGACAARYVVGLAGLMLLHAGAVNALVTRVELPIVLAKLVSDVTLLAGGQLLILRYLVFPRNKSRPAPPSRRTRARSFPDRSRTCPPSPFLRASSSRTNSSLKASRPWASPTSTR